MFRGFGIFLAFSAVALSCKPTDSSVRGTRQGGKRKPALGEVVVERGVIRVAEYAGKIDAKDFVPKQGDWKVYEFLKGDTFKPGNTYRIRFQLLESNDGKLTVARTWSNANSPCPEQVFFPEAGKSGNVRIPVCRLDKPVPTQFPDQDSDFKAPPASTLAEPTGNKIAYLGRVELKYWDPCPWMADWFLGTATYVEPKTTPAKSQVVTAQRTGDSIALSSSADLPAAAATVRFTPFTLRPSGDCAAGTEAIDDSSRGQVLYFDGAQYAPGTSISESM